MGTRKEPLRFVCKACGKPCETRNTGNKGQFCGKPCRADYERKGREQPRRYRQGRYWMLCWTIPGGTGDRPNRRFQFEHRRIWEDANGPIPAGHEIHHVNGNGFDNRLENLQCLRMFDHRSMHKRKYASIEERNAEYARRARERRARRKMAK